MQRIIMLSFGALLLAGALPLAAAPLSPCDSVAGNLVTNCGFETGDFTAWTQGVDIDFTQVVSGPFYLYSGANGGTWYATMGPEGTGTLSQTLTTTVGQQYLFSFYIAGVADDPSTFNASWNGTQLLTTTDLDTGAAFTQFSFSVTGTGSDTINFSFSDPTGYEAMDDVVVVSAPTPEPGTLGLIFGGLGAALVALRRRRIA
jgi:hypothetical protein